MKMPIATTKKHETIRNSYETMMAQDHKLWSRIQHGMIVIFRSCSSNPRNQPSKPQWVQAGAAARCNPWYVRNPRPPKRHTSGQIGLSMCLSVCHLLNKSPFKLALEVGGAHFAQDLVQNENHHQKRKQTLVQNGIPSSYGGPAACLLASQLRPSKLHRRKLCYCYSKA